MLITVLAFDFVQPWPPLPPPPPPPPPPHDRGLGVFTTVYLQIILAVDPDTQVFPIAYKKLNGQYASTVTRAELQAELDSRMPIQNEIWGLGYLPDIPPPPA